MENSANSGDSIMELVRAKAVPHEESTSFKTIRETEV